MGTHTSGATREEINPKRTARHEARIRIQRLDAGWIARASAEITKRVLELPAWKSSASMAAYVSQPREVQTRDLIATALAAGKRVCVPAWRSDWESYSFAWIGPGIQMRSGPFGIEEPASPAWADAAELGLFLVPLRAFDIHGRRLGHGGGYFDRLLSRAHGAKAGLAFENQRLTAVPSEPHDVRLDFVVTEKSVHTTGTTSR